MEECIFCKIIKGEIPSKKVYEDDKILAIMDVNPQVDGHVLVIPKKHIKDYKELQQDDLDYLNTIASKLSDELISKLDAKGITFAVNYGDSQSVKHFQLHLLPDYLLKEKSNRTLDEIYEIIK